MYLDPLTPWKIKVLVFNSAIMFLLCFACHMTSIINYITKQDPKMLPKAL